VGQIRLEIPLVYGPVIPEFQSNLTLLVQLSQTIARRVGRFLERQGLLERDAENSYLAGDALEAGPMDQLLGHSITYRIAIGPQQGRKASASCSRSLPTSL